MLWILFFYISKYQSTDTIDSRISPHIFLNFDPRRHADTHLLALIYADILLSRICSTMSVLQSPDAATSLIANWDNYNKEKDIPPTAIKLFTTNKSRALKKIFLQSLPILNVYCEYLLVVNNSYEYMIISNIINKKSFNCSKKPDFRYNNSLFNKNIINILNISHQNTTIIKLIKYSVLLKYVLPNYNVNIDYIYFSPDAEHEYYVGILDLDVLLFTTFTGTPVCKIKFNCDLASHRTVTKGLDISAFLPAAMVHELRLTRLIGSTLPDYDVVPLDVHSARIITSAKTALFDAAFFDLSLLNTLSPALVRYIDTLYSFIRVTHGTDSVILHDRVGHTADFILSLRDKKEIPVSTGNAKRYYLLDNKHYSLNIPISVKHLQKLDKIYI